MSLRGLCSFITLHKNLLPSGKTCVAHNLTVRVIHVRISVLVFCFCLLTRAMWMSEFLEPKPLDQQIVSTRYRLCFWPFVSYHKNNLVVPCPHICVLNTVVML